MQIYFNFWTELCIKLQSKIFFPFLQYTIKFLTFCFVIKDRNDCLKERPLRKLLNFDFQIDFFSHPLFAVCFRYSIFKDQNVTLVTFGIGLCSKEETENCLVFVNLLDKAVMPVPTCMADGTMVWPKGECPLCFIFNNY